MITYNTPSDERESTSHMSLQESEQAVKVMNQLIDFYKQNCDLHNGELPDGKEKLLQKFVHYYENLEHHKSVLEGLYATEFPEKVLNGETFTILNGFEIETLFKIKF